MKACVQTAPTSPEPLVTPLPEAFAIGSDEEASDAKTARQAVGIGMPNSGRPHPARCATAPHLSGPDPLGKQSGLPSPPSKMPLEKTGMYQLLKTHACGAPLAVPEIENQSCPQEKVGAFAASCAHKQKAESSPSAARIPKALRVCCKSPTAREIHRIGSRMLSK